MYIAKRKFIIFYLVILQNQILIYIYIYVCKNTYIDIDK